MKIDYIRRAESVAGVRDEILAAPVLGVDTETTALDPLKGRLRLLQFSPTPERAIIFDLDHIDARDSCFDFARDTFTSERVKMFHNAKFDLRWLKTHFGAVDFNTVYDTYLASQILACGDDMVRNNLKAVAARYAYLDVDKTEQRSDFGITELSDEKLRYAAIDSICLHAIRDGQNRHLAAADLMRCAMLEFDAVDEMADLENNGFYMDGDQWLARCADQDAELKAAAAALDAHFAPISSQQSFFGGSDVNLDSPEQVLEGLKKLGVPIEESTLEHKITGFKDKFPVVADLLKYREISTALKTFGPKYVKFIDDISGRIHSDFKQIGTPTGRTTSSDPNLQQIPADNRYRSCFKAPEGRRLVVADYSQIELRLMAQFSRDEKLVKAYLEEIDLHRQTASEVMGKPFDECGKGTPERRIGKDLNFGTAYGIGAKRFGQKTGLSYDASEKVLKRFWEIYSALDQYLKDNGQRALDEHEVHSYSGRTWRLNYDPADRKSMGDVERLGRNFPIQASCSDIFKRALHLMKALRRGHASAKLVNIVHDEIIVECDEHESEGVKTELVKIMEQAGSEVLTVVPCKVDATICVAWEK